MKAISHLNFKTVPLMAVIFTLVMGFSESVSGSSFRSQDLSDPLLPLEGSTRPEALSVALFELEDEPPSTATPTSTPSFFVRPLIVVESYNIGGYAVLPGQEFDLNFRLSNAGRAKARNIVVVFVTGNFIPRGNGGVLAAGVIASEASTGYIQRLAAGQDLAEGAMGTLALQITYTDDTGAGYSEDFTLSIPIATEQKKSSPGYYYTPTPSPTPAPRPQLLIQAYRTDIFELRPGSQFSLSLEAENVGGKTAKRITMVMGGGMSINDSGSENDPSDSGTGGLSGGGGDFSNFAPLGSSNIKFLGDLDAGNSLTASQMLIVNGSTKPGAYPVKFSFVYTDEKGTSFTDDQVITLLVVSSPLLDISFYRQPDPFFAGQPGQLPIQIVNLDRNSVILSRMEVTAEGAQLENNSSLIGFLDPGGYFTLDPMIIPDQPGTIIVTVKVDYLDDFNQPQSILQELSIEVMEASAFEPGAGEIPGTDVSSPTVQETAWQKVLRFLRGFFGLDSAPMTPSESVPPPSEMVPPSENPPIVVPEPKG